MDRFAVDRHACHEQKASAGSHRSHPETGTRSRMPRVTTTLGYSLGYEEAGAGGATPIVFLHGVGSDKSAWRPQLRYFGRERRSLAFDYPGYGDSDPAPEGTTRDDYAAAILSAMHALGVTSAHVCGLSLGGVVA